MPLYLYSSYCTRKPQQSLLQSQQRQYEAATTQRLRSREEIQYVQTEFSPLLTALFGPSHAAYEVD